jgi:two-component system, LytTR family, sensor kinase
MSTALKRYAMVLCRALPYFALWVLVAKTSAAITLREALMSSAISAATATVLGIGVWYSCMKLPWPLRAKMHFYALQCIFSLVYALLWNLLICCVESLRGWTNLFPRYWTSRGLGWQLLIGVFIYGAVSGVSYSVQIRNRLRDKEVQAMKAEALAANARMIAIRARLNPHFLFNALHTLSALAKFKPTLAEGAFERLGDMLRYALREDQRHVVEFSQEYDFTQQYLTFEQLRYEDRLHVRYDIDSESFQCCVPPFSIQALAENAVRHAISTCPEGGSISIASTYYEGRLTVTVRDDGPGEARDERESHQLGLSSLRERLNNLFGSDAVLTTTAHSNGFEARFEIPNHGDYDTSPFSGENNIEHA